jgi:hypothetical protein
MYGSENIKTVCTFLGKEAKYHRSSAHTLTFLNMTHQIVNFKCNFLLLSDFEIIEILAFLPAW